MPASPRPKKPGVAATAAVPAKRNKAAPAAPSHKRTLAVSHQPTSNRLLAALPDAELQRWLPQLEMVSLPLGFVLYESGRIEKFVYFPTTAIISLLYVMENGDSAEIAVVGNEGIVGHLAVHGRPVHAQPCGGAKRRRGLSPGGRTD